MKIAIGADHAGYLYKAALVNCLKAKGHEAVDVGADSDQISVDYPDFAERIARLVASGECEKGVALCGTGIGMSIAANRIPGIRAALCHDLLTARMSREHNDANILVLGARITALPYAEEILHVFLDTPFEGGRHQHRIDKIHALDLKKD